MMKMVIAIVSNEDSQRLLGALLKNNYKATKLSTTGGFLNAGNTTFLIGCTEEQVENVLKVISDYSHSRKQIVPSSITNELGLFASSPVEVNVGGATIFVVDVEQFMKI